MAESKSGINVTILGSGTCVPSLKRSSCSVLMEVGSSKLLFDSGPGTMRRLLEAKTTIFDISHIFYSHFHLDHTGEFAPFIFSTKYPGGTQRKIPLTVVGGRGFLDFYNALKTAYGRWIELAPGLLNIIEFDNKRSDARKFEDFKVDTAPVAHNEESIAYRITSADGQSALYTGDTDYSETIIDLAENADLLICESAFPEKFREKGHLTPSLAGDLATRAGVRKLVLTHLYPECDKEDIAAECRKTYSGPLVLAEDLMEIKIR
jgi:ribonuclease BN (tRNA processing enzyme)